MEMKVNREMIRELRLQKSWSQEKLADIADVSLRTVQRVETNGVASLQSRTAIAKALAIEPAELDIEVNHRAESTYFGRTQIQIFFPVALKWVINILRGVSIVLVSAIGSSLFAMALLKPFAPGNVGLFSSESTISFGIIRNTSSMQEHLGLWVIPLAIVAGLILLKCAILLFKARVEKQD